MSLTKRDGGVRTRRLLTRSGEKDERQGAAQLGSYVSKGSVCTAGENESFHGRQREIDCSLGRLVVNRFCQTKLCRQMEKKTPPRNDPPVAPRFVRSSPFAWGGYQQKQSEGNTKREGQCYRNPRRRREGEFRGGWFQEKSVCGETPRF